MVLFDTLVNSRCLYKLFLLSNRFKYCESKMKSFDLFKYYSAVYFIFFRDDSLMCKECFKQTLQLAECFKSLPKLKVSGWTKRDQHKSQPIIYY